MGIRLELFSRNYFCHSAQYLRSSHRLVWGIQGICQTSSGKPVLAEQSGPLFAPADLLITTPRLSIEILSPENLLQKCKEREERFPQPYRLIKFCNDAGFQKTAEVGQYFMTKHTDEFLHFQSQWHVVKKFNQEATNQRSRKVGFEGTPKLDPCWKSRTSYLQGKYGVEIRIEFASTRHFSLVGQNFSWIEQVGHRLDRQRVRGQRAGNLK